MFAVQSVSLLFLTAGVVANAVDDKHWAGVNSFYLHALSSSDQDEVVGNLNDAGVKVVRIFLSSVDASAKGSSSIELLDLEQVEVGEYDDDILDRVDALMDKLRAQDMKLIVALHDRYSLGCWASDAYVNKYDLPVTDDCGTAANQPDNFYANSSAVADFDSRIRYVLAHKNPYFDNRMWSELDEVVYAFDVENEAQAYMNTRDPSWMCGRAETIRSALGDSGILVGTGGGGAFGDSLEIDYFTCPSLDIVSVHSYADISEYAASLQQGLLLADTYNKTIVFEEFGKTDSKGEFLSNVWAMTNFYQIPSMPWEVMKPNNPEDFEFYVDDVAAWDALRVGALAATGALYSEGAWCTHNADCASECCTNTHSGDPGSLSYGRFVCINNSSSADSCNAPSEDKGIPNGSFCAKSSQCSSLCCRLEESLGAMVCGDDEGSMGGIYHSSRKEDNIRNSESYSCLYP